MTKKKQHKVGERFEMCKLIYEVQAMSYAGIKVANEDGRAKYLSDIRYEIGKFLRMY